MTAPNRFYQGEQKLCGSAYYIWRRDCRQFARHSLFLRLAPGRKITTSFPRSNPEWRPAVTRRCPPANVSLVPDRACAYIYIRRRVRVLEEIYNGTRARKASRRWASCVTSSCVGMRKYTSGEREKEGEKGSETNLRSIYTATLNL